MITDERFIELMNKEIDGLNSPQESEELKAYVQSSAEARELYQDLLKLSTVLSRAEEVEPPQSLKSGILAAIRTSRRPVRSESPLMGWIKELFESRTAFQYAYVFSAGLLLGIAIYSLVGVYPTTSGVVDPSSVSGTIIISGPAYPFTDGQGFEFNLEAESVSGSVATKHSQNLAVVEIELQSNDLVEVTVLFNPEELHFRGYSQSEPTTGERNVQETSFRMTTQGKNHYILAFERKAQNRSEVTVTVERGEVELHRQALRIGEKPS